VPNVVITGASAGVGRALARRFAQEGYDVGLIARSAARLQEAAAEVENHARRALVLPADVADARAIEDAAERFEAEVGPIDIWVNCAMATVLAPVAETSAEEFARVTEVTYLGTVHGTRTALGRMRHRDRGLIIQIGSALAYRSIPLQSAYCAAKSAVVGFTDSLRSELLHDGSNIELTVVHLPAVNTPQFDWARNKMERRPQPVPPIFDPDRIAEQVVRAARQPAREYWLGFPAVKAILSYELAPWLGDRLLSRQGYEGQLTEEAEDPTRADNLFDPVPGAFSAHGRFADRSTERRPILVSPALRQGAALATVLVMLAAAFVLGALLF
jgi:short-subunit dehydrogenase